MGEVPLYINEHERLVAEGGGTMVVCRVLSVEGVGMSVITPSLSKPTRGTGTSPGISSTGSTRT